MALSNFAIDNDGFFPIGDGDSNSAYRQLFDAKFQDENLFYVPGSAWNKKARPDGVVGTPPDYPDALAEGENHWAYANALNNGSKGTLPLIMEGFTEQKVSVYSDDPNIKGGLHDDTAIVVQVDGSALVIDISLHSDAFDKVDPSDLLNPL